MENISIDRDDILADVEAAFIAHYWVEYYVALVQHVTPFLFQYQDVWLTPEERARGCRRLKFQVSSNCPHSFHSLGAGSVAGEQDIEICEIGLFEAGINFRYFLGSGAGALELLIARVIALIVLVSGGCNPFCSLADWNWEKQTY